MFEVTEYEIVTLLEDEEFVNEVIERALASPEVVDDLAEDLASSLSDVFEDDPRIQRQLLTKALEGDGFKRRVIQQLIEELGDD